MKYKLVPVEATKEILEAWKNQPMSNAELDWKAMLAAAPSPAEEFIEGLIDIAWMAIDDRMDIDVGTRDLGEAAARAIVAALKDGEK